MTSVELKKWDEILEGVGGDEKVATHLWLKWKCLTDLFFLGYEVMGLKEAKDRGSGRRLVDPEYHGWLCDVLTTDQDIMVIVPRRHMKTTWVKIKLIQNILKNPMVRQAMYSSTSTLVEQELASIKRMLETPMLMNLFPEIIPAMGKKGVNWQVNRAAELTMFRNPEEGNPPQECQIEVYGVGSTVTGKHFDIHIYDDLINEKTTQTMEQLAKTRDWYGYIQGVLEPGGQEIYIGTPYHHEDLTVWIEREGIYDRVVKRGYRENGKIVYSYFTEKMIAKLRKRYTPYQFSCNPGDAPIWMADGSFQNLCDIQPGDMVMGFVCEGGRYKLTPSRVLRKRSRIADTVTLKMESGSILRCTPDHLWYAGSKEIRRGKPEYAKPCVYGTWDWRKKGARGPYTTILYRAITPPDKVTYKEELKYQYLAGIIDGEGSCKHGSIIITQSRDKNPEVCERIDKTFDDLGIKCSKWIRAERIGHKTADYWIINGGRDIKAKIIQYGRPAKAGQIASTIINKKRVFDKPDKILSMVANRLPEVVYAMQTETGNYIAWGYGSKNCQMEVEPIPREDQPFPPPQPQYTQLPVAKYNYYIAVDPAATIKSYSDETAIVVAAVSELGNVYVEEALHFKKPGNEIAEIILKLNERYKPRKVGVEFGLQEHLRYIIDLTRKHWEAAQGHSISLPLEGIDITKRDKFDRINLTVGSFIRSGRLSIKSSQYDLMHQMGLYNKNYTGKDDLVDALSMVFAIVETFSYRYWQQPLGIIKKGYYTIESLFKNKKAVGYSDRFSN